MSTAHRTVVIINQRGLHARAASKLASLASKFQAQITVSRGNQTVSGCSIMGLMMLAAGIGSKIKLSADGRDADAALNAICGLINDRFQED
ncbi:MAG: HPr family phosphocarrier protein [Magnetovibrio sp.]|nr:HPr family phosphocarrier protein [Magnetovibrio sp.]